MLDNGSVPARRRPRLVGARAAGVAAVVPVALGELDALSSVRVYMPQDLRPPDARALALKARPLRCCMRVACLSALQGWVA